MTMPAQTENDETVRPHRKRPARTNTKREAIRESAGIQRRRTHPKGR